MRDIVRPIKPEFPKGRMRCVDMPHEYYLKFQHDKLFFINKK